MKETIRPTCFRFCEMRSFYFEIHPFLVSGLNSVVILIAMLEQ